MIPLVPTNRKIESKIPKYAVCDIESLRWIEGLVIGFYGKLKIDDKVVFEDEQYFENMFEFCDYCFEKRQPFDQIFAHFGGKFDFQFIMKSFYEMREIYHISGMIPRGSGLLCFTVSTFELHDFIPEGISEKDYFGKNKDGKFKIKKRSIQFKDSSAILPFGLGSLTKNFGVEHVKGDFDFEAFNLKYKDFSLEETRSLMKMNGDWSTMMTYLSHDLKGLYEVLDQYFNQPIIYQAGSAYTTASQALKVFQNFLDQKIPSLHPGDDSYTRGAYFGGRTEVFKPFFQASSKHPELMTYDVNSLYPFIMKTLEFPYKIKSRGLTRISDSSPGVYDVTVNVPDWMYIPPLGISYTFGSWNRYIFPTGIFRGKWTDLELKYAESLGVKILKVHSGMTFKTCGFLFKKYIETLYDLRKKSIKGSVDDIIYKLLMNSLYGRFGLNVNREELTFDDGFSESKPFLTLSETATEMIRLCSSPKVLENSFVNVSIATWVTSGARVHMHKQYMENPKEIYYTDTDSLMTTHTFKNDEKKLGALKHEMSSKRACFILPKTYIMENLKGELKTVMKGFDRRKIKNFTMEDFEAALEGELKRLRTTNPEKFATFKTALSKGTFLRLIKEAPRGIKSKYDKRRLIKSPINGEWDSEPLKLDGHIIRNKPDTETMKKLSKLEREYLEAGQDISAQIML